MKEKRYTEEQIISILEEHEAGASVPELSRRHGVAENTSYRWKSTFGGMEVSEALRQRLRVLAERYPRYGYPTLHALLAAEGRVINRKRTWRLYREEGLQVRTRRRKKLRRPRVPIPVPVRANERWSADFVSDQLANGRRFRVLNLVDDFSRECGMQLVDLSISGQRLAREFERLAHRLPRTIACDNGPQFIRKEIFYLARKTGVMLQFSPANRRTTLLSKASTASSGSIVSACTGSPVSRTPVRSSPNGALITIMSGPIDHWARSHPPCSPKRWLDMDQFPHSGWLESRGTVKIA